MNNASEKDWVLITGCSSGIGLASALRLKQLGYGVVTTARDPGDIKSLESAGLNPVLMNLMDFESVDNGVEEALKKSGGKIYGVFHNAGYGQSGAIEDLPVEALLSQFQINVFAAHAINLKLIPIMRQAGRGRIVFNSSILGFFAMPYRGFYNSSKFAIEGLADTLRLELYGSGVRVSILEPGPISTRFRENSLRAFYKHVDPKNSVHAKRYEGMIARLGKVGDTSTFTLGASACVEPVVHALQSSKPKTRYRVTTPTKMMNVLKRILPTSVLDSMAQKGF
jgi:short-subunit dehydrogenase